MKIRKTPRSASQRNFAFKGNLVIFLCFENNKIKKKQANSGESPKLMLILQTHNPMKF